MAVAKYCILSLNVINFLMIIKSSFSILNICIKSGRSSILVIFVNCFSLLVLDMARHVPLYRALLELLRAIASCTSMVPLLLPLSGESSEEEEEQLESQASVGTLLAKMKTCVDTYTNRLR